VKVVFLEDVPGTANIGDIKDVKAGFARNYLLPRKLAAPATAAIVKTAEQRAAREAKLQDARDNEARTIGERLAGEPIVITARAGPSGKLFGSVGTNDVAEKVAALTGAAFDRQNVMMPETIKELGDHQVNVRLTRNVQATLNISVVGEDGTTMADIRARGGAGAEAQPAETQPADETSETAEEAGD
jgi:large subunit ribosomal protein L9